MFDLMYSVFTIVLLFIDFLEELACNLIVVRRKRNNKKKEKKVGLFKNRTRLDLVSRRRPIEKTEHIYILSICISPFSLKGFPHDFVYR